MIIIQEIEALKHTVHNINSCGRKKSVLVSEGKGFALHIFAKNLQRSCDAFRKTGLSSEVILRWPV